ncbi:MAG: hydrogenase expression/formation protein HypE [Chitinispirillaceae bacterium]|nr:hydrogenase expression/formation protein HypE [Chitinispirillaceae bacterium]
MIATIHLSHGSGRGLEELLHEIVIPSLGGANGPLEDAAVFSVENERLAFTTDSFVVQPLEFPGGSIGTLAACGTLNDLVMMGARPRFISVALILEEGLDAALVIRTLEALREECSGQGVVVACGDTKVVDRGKADGIFITTSGIGTLPPGRSLSIAGARPGDAIIISGPIGRHGIAIMAARQGLNFASAVTSDCACLYPLVEILLAAAPGTHTLRDATRGGCSAVLNEMAQSSGVTVHLKQELVPVTPEVANACAFLGLDPLHVANEGTFVAAVPREQAVAALDALKTHPLGSGAVIAGTVEEQGRFPVVMETAVGGTRMVDLPSGELLPRIC